MARGLYEKPVEYDPMFKLVLVVNDKPLMTTTDKGVKRRVEMLPFNAEFEGDKRKLDLEETLLTEREGILAWMVEGLRQYNAEGIGTCTAIQETTSEYIEEMNPLHDYVEDRLELGPDFTVRGSDLLFDLEEYWDSRPSVERLGSHGVKEALSAYGIEKRTRKEISVWIGTRLKGAITRAQPQRDESL